MKKYLEGVFPDILKQKTKKKNNIFSDFSVPIPGLLIDNIHSSKIKIKWILFLYSVK
jgi:hypothetical protein